MSAISSVCWMSVWYLYGSMKSTIIFQCSQPFRLANGESQRNFVSKSCVYICASFFHLLNLNRKQLKLKRVAWVVSSEYIRKRFPFNRWNAIIFIKLLSLSYFFFFFLMFCWCCAAILPQLHFIQLFLSHKTW